MGGRCKKVRAHRFSWEFHRGPIPDGMMVCHTCDNRKCCNPDHIFLGDGLANMQDMVNKGRHGSQTGTLRPKITRPMARNIRVMYARGNHSIKLIARIYGLTPSTVSGIVKGRSHLFVDA